jgi:hypothetical protein
MRIAIIRQGNGKVASPTVKAYCDTDGCMYTTEVNLSHSNGTSTAKYEKPDTNVRKLESLVTATLLKSEIEALESAKKPTPGIVGEGTKA